MLRMRPTPVPRAYTPPLLPPQIGRAVAMLRSHRDLRLAQRANAVVAAGSIVARDVPAATVVAGNPARTVGSREQGAGGTDLGVR